MEGKEQQEKSHKKSWKIVLLGTVSLIVILVISHFVWKYSGSGEWELERDKNGVKIWTKKTPGRTRLQFKVTFISKTKLAPIVFWLTSPETAGDVGGRDFKILEEIKVPNGYIAYESYVYDMPFPFGTLEGVVLAVVHPQDPKTKKIVVDIIAAPNKTPLRNNVYRISHLHDIWHLTPLANGEVDITMFMDLTFDPLPYFIFNKAMPEDIYKNHVLMRELLKKEKNKNAKIDYIKEVDE